MSFQDLMFLLLEKSDEYSVSSYTSKMEPFAKIFNDLNMAMKVIITFMELSIKPVNWDAEIAA